MEAPPHKLFQDLLMLVLFIVWAFKIGFHFNYLRAVDPSIRERSFATFYLNPFNILRSIAVILPVFVAGSRGQEIEKAQRLRQSTLRSILLFWFILVCLCFDMYTQPTEKAKTSHHDLKEGEPWQRSAADWKFILFKEGKDPMILPSLTLTIEDVDQYFRSTE